MGINPAGDILGTETTMTIGAILTAKRGGVVGVTTTTPVREIVRQLHDNRIGAVLVLGGRGIEGIVSERDVVAALHRLGSAALDSAASDVMTAPVVTAAPESSVTAAMATMTNRRIRHLPVVADGELLGLVSIGDLVKRRIEDAEHEASALKDYIAAS